MAARSKTVVDIRPLLDKLRRVPGLLEAEMKPKIEAEGRLLVQEIVKWTPPASEGTTGGKAKRQGEMAITADLLSLGISAGRDKTRRTAGVFSVMDDNMLAATAKMRPDGTVVLFVKKDGTVYGTDRKHYRPNASLGEMKAHHQSLRGAGGRVTKAGGATRDIGRWKFVDQMVVGNKAFRRYEKHAHKKVGLLAAGWNAAAARLGARLPIWVKRHGNGDGSVRIEKTPNKFVVIMSNSVSYATRQDMQRRVNWVMAMRKAKFTRQLPFILRAAIKKAKLS